MVRLRKAPICPKCGERIGEIHKKREAWESPMYGDSFIEWDWAGHICAPIDINIKQDEELEQEYRRITSLERENGMHNWIRISAFIEFVKEEKKKAQVEVLEEIMKTTEYIPCTSSDIKIRKWRGVGAQLVRNKIRKQIEQLKQEIGED